jgi:hypothetical protein
MIGTSEGFGRKMDFANQLKLDEWFPPFGGMKYASDALEFCNSYNRLPTLIALWRCCVVGDIDWLTLLGAAWTGCDNISDFTDELLNDTPLEWVLFQGADGAPLMTEDERSAFEALPEQVTVYRGCYRNNKWGLSWSLDRDVAAAHPFLNRYRREGQPLLVKAIARKSKIAALFLDREEAEIVTYRPRHVATSHLRSPIATVRD